MVDACHLTPIISKRTLRYSTRAKHNYYDYDGYYDVGTITAAFDDVGESWKKNKIM